MPGAILWDTVRGARFERNNIGYKVTRTGVATSLDTTNPYALLTQVGALAPAGGEAYPDSAYASAKLNRLIVYPTDAGTEDALVEAVFETAGFSYVGGTPFGIYVVQDDSQLVNELTEVDVNGDTLFVDYIEGNTIGESIRLPTRVPQMSCRRALRSLNITGVVEARPSESFREKIGYVNDDTWQGRPAGYWMLDKFRASVTRSSIGFGVEMRFTTRDTRSWLQLNLYRRHGQVVPGLNREAIKALMNGDYFVGQVPGNGYTVVGNHLTADFSVFV